MLINSWLQGKKVTSYVMQGRVSASYTVIRTTEKDRLYLPFDTLTAQKREVVCLTVLQGKDACIHALKCVTHYVKVTYSTPNC